MLELTCQDCDLEVLAGSDLAVLRAVTDAITVNVPLTIAGAAALVDLLAPFAQAAAS